MIPYRSLYARFAIDTNPPAEQAFRARKVDGERRMRAAGIREASIVKYLRRGWPSAWTRALCKEMDAVVEHLRCGVPRWKKPSQRDLDAAEARRLMGCE